jgi:uncharacterized protein YjeT (DUF2065 family)
MSRLVEAVGLVLVIEGLVFALAPRRLEEALMLLARLPVETRRLLGLGTLAMGVALLALARWGGAG